MTLMSRTFYLILIFGFVYALKDEKKDGEDMFKMYKAQIPLSGNGMMGVASIAGYTSRNGRVSSIGSVQFFPSLNQPISLTNSEIINKINDNLASSFSKMYPEPSKLDKNTFPKALSPTLAFASTNIGSNQEPLIWPNILDPMAWQVSEVPQTSYNIKRDVGNWFYNDIYNNFAPSEDNIGDTWIYPTFNPFFLV